MKANIPIPELRFDEEVWLMVFITSQPDLSVLQAKSYTRVGDNSAKLRGQSTRRAGREAQR
jgi:hypothetical protein